MPKLIAISNGANAYLDASRDSLSIMASQDRGLNPLSIMSTGDHRFQVTWCANDDIDALTLVNKRTKYSDDADNLTKVISTMGIRFDTFSDKIIFKDRDGVTKPFADSHYVDVQIGLIRAGFKEPTLDKVKSIVRSVAQKMHTDSAAEWGNKLVWDKTSRVDKMLSTYFGCADDEYSMACAKYLATAMAGRLLGGCKADMVLVLTGAQGLFKSTAVAQLTPFPGSFAEADLTKQDDDLSRLIKGKIIVELDEMRGFNKRESSSIKSWITRLEDEWTPKYQEFAVKYRRRCVFIATTNETEFLNDPTGNRRYLPLDVIKACDPEGLSEVREQIWAEAIHMFKDSGVLWGAAQIAAASRHSNYVVGDEIMDELVQDFLSKRVSKGENFKLQKVLDFVKPDGQHDRNLERRVTASLRRCDAKPVRVTGGGRFWKSDGTNDTSVTAQF